MENKSQIISAAKWKIAEKIGSKGAQVVIQIILARLLMPDDYGTLAILTVFINLANVFIQTGFSTALIQKLEADDKDFSTCFYASTIIATVLYLLIWFSAPYIANFYNMKEITSLLRIFSIVLFAGAINSVQYAYISRYLKFRIYTIAIIISSISSGIIGITLAYRKWGVWALVMQQLLANIISVLLLMIMAEWKPKLEFSFERLKNIWSYGWKILGMGMLNSMYSSLYTLVVGKAFNSEALGLYNRADQFPHLLASNINETVQAVSLPILAQKQKEKKQFVERFRLAMKSNVFILVPCMLGMATIAPEMLEVLLTDKWLGAVPLMRILCCIYAMYPIHTMNIQAIKASGRSDILLITEIIKKAVEISTLLFTVRYGLIVMLMTQLLISLTFAVVINTVPTSRLYNYGFFKQIKDIWKCYLSSFLMAVVVIMMGNLFNDFPPVVKMILEIIAGALLFIFLEILLKDESMKIVLNSLKFGKRL